MARGEREGPGTAGSQRWNDKQITLKQTLQVNIERWSAWAPGLESAQDWIRWSQSGVDLPKQESPPDLKFLPSLMRRRLSAVGKMALKVAYDCAAEKEGLRTIFSSRHGEANQTISLLNDIVRGEPMSPTKFSLSVHNTSSGLYTITAGVTAPATAIAARLDTFEMGFVEACSCIAAGREEKVMLVYADTPLQPPFDVLVDYEPPFAAAFVLSAPTTPGSLLLSMTGREEGSEISKVPHFLAFMKFFLGPSQDPLHLVTDRLRWTWAKDARHRA